MVEASESWSQIKRKVKYIQRKKTSQLKIWTQTIGFWVQIILNKKLDPLLWLTFNLFLFTTFNHQASFLSN